MSLNPEDDRVGYCLGRLFAVLENLQGAAQNSLNTTIRDRYYSSASCNPLSVFGTLVRLSSHHLNKLRKDKPALCKFFDMRLGSIMSLLGDGFPPHLNLEQQGLFAIGYYHEKYYKHPTKNEDSHPEQQGDAA